MSLRNLIRLLAACAATIPVTLITWKATGVWPLLGGLAGLLLTLGYLALLAGGGDLTRWQLRYHLEPGADTERLEATLRYLADRAGHLVLEASSEGLFLELPVALDRYVEAQLPLALPELRLSRDENRQPAGRALLFSQRGYPEQRTPALGDRKRGEAAADARTPGALQHADRAGGSTAVTQPLVQDAAARAVEAALAAPAGVG